MIKEKIKLIDNALSNFQEQSLNCNLCPRKCGINRLQENSLCSQKGLKIFKYFLHQGEEPVITGTKGSGTIFFSGCNLKCVYCQNYKFSHEQNGDIYSVEQLADIMIDLQNQGAHNINFVTPTHVLIYILPALKIAYEKGLHIPLVYNTSSYDSENSIKLLDGIIDVYLADFRYYLGESAKKYSMAEDYPDVCRNILKIMYKQVRNSIIDDNGIMQKGMIVRHLVLPNHSNESILILDWLSINMPDVLLSLMSQFRPYYKAINFKNDIDRALSKAEYSKVASLAEELCFDGWIQDNPDESLAGVYF